MEQTSVCETIKEIKTQLRLFMNGAVSHSMREKGLMYKLNFGVELPRIKEIAARYPKDHQLAQALWKEEIRECKILAALLQPHETFYPEIADIWVESIQHTEIAELTCMNLFQHLSYAPSKAFQWIASEQIFVQICGYLTIVRLLQKRGEMAERVENEFLDQAITAFLSGTYPLRQAVLTAVRCYIRQGDAQAFSVCRRVERFAHATTEAEQLLYTLVQTEVSDAD